MAVFPCARRTRARPGWGSHPAAWAARSASSAPTRSPLCSRILPTSARGPPRHSERGPGGQGGGGGGELRVRQHGMRDVISRRAGRLRSLIEDVMMLSRSAAGPGKKNVVPVPIPALITRAGEDLWLVAQSSAIELQIDAGPEAAIVMGDRVSLDRAVINILSNAIKFSRPGGVVTLTGVLDKAARRVLVTCQDRGVGIPAQDQVDLFTRFFRASNATDQAIPGVGLGLSIVKQIVEEHHGGQLRLTSVEGEGTTVVVDLPLSAGRSPVPDGNDSQADDVFGIRA